LCDLQLKKKANDDHLQKVDEDYKNFSSQFL